MADHYIRNQKAIIRKKLQKDQPGIVIWFLLLLMVLFVLIHTFPAPPGQWQSEEVIFVDSEYRTMRTLSRYPPKGYELTDQNGHRYWAGSELTWQVLEKPYSVRYYSQGGYRVLTRVEDETGTLVDEADSITEWENRSDSFGLLLMIWSILLVLYIRYLYQVLHHPVIVECRRRIRLHETKLQRRRLDQQFRNNL